MHSLREGGLEKYQAAQESLAQAHDELHQALEELLHERERNAALEASLNVLLHRICAYVWCVEGWGCGWCMNARKKLHPALDEVLQERERNAALEASPTFCGSILVGWGGVGGWVHR